MNNLKRTEKLKNKIKEIEEEIKRLENEESVGQTVIEIIKDMVDERAKTRLKNLKELGVPNIVIEAEQNKIDTPVSKYKVNGLSRKYKNLRNAKVDSYSSYQTKSKVWGKGWKNSTVIKMVIEVDNKLDTYYYNYQNNKFGLKREHELKQY